MKKLIMTDLDCTLLIMNQDLYIKMYVEEIVKLFNEKGYDGKMIAKATMGASMRMLKNDGSCTNQVAFEAGFKEAIKENAQEIIDIFPQVYGDSYDNIKSITRVNEYASEIVRLMKEKSQYIAVATQPMFPIEAVQKRLSWTNLSDKSFDYISVYDNSSYSKPNPKYYLEIMEKYGAKPEETLMIGNDVNEDILPCESIGVDTFLVLDGLINSKEHDISGMRKGSYTDLINYLKSL